MRRGTAADDPPALPAPLRTPIAIVAALAAVVCAMVAIRYAGEASPGRLDIWAKAAVTDVWSEPGLGVLLIASVGDPLWAVLCTGLLAVACLALGRRRLAVVVVAGMGISGIVTTVLKPVVGRTINGGFLAYPSGHTAAATVLALVVMLLLVDLLDARRLPGMLLTLSGAGVAGVGMALSQIVVDTHYLSDTVGGFCVALVIVPATAHLVDRLGDRRCAT